MKHEALSHVCSHLSDPCLLHGQQERNLPEYQYVIPQTQRSMPRQTVHLQLQHSQNGNGTVCLTMSDTVKVQFSFYQNSKLWYLFNLFCTSQCVWATEVGLLGDNIANLVCDWLTDMDLNIFRCRVNKNPPWELFQKKRRNWTDLMFCIRTCTRVLPSVEIDSIENAN